MENEKKVLVAACLSAASTIPVCIQAVLQHQKNLNNALQHLTARKGLTSQRYERCLR